MGDYNVATLPDWARRAVENPARINNPDGSKSSVRTITYSADGKHYVAPTIRLVEGNLKAFDQKDAVYLAMQNKDGIPFNTLEEAEAFSKGFSDYLGKIGVK